MKAMNIRTIALIAIHSICVGCMVEQSEYPESSEQLMTFAAYSADKSNTNTQRDEETRAVLWTPGDAISLFYGSGTDGGRRFVSNATEPSSRTNFTGSIEVITGSADVDNYYWGLYPYDETAEFDGVSVVTTLPSAQRATPGTFANNLFPSLGRTQGSSIGFYNICGGVMFSVASDDIKSVSFKATGGEFLSGKSRIGFVDERPKVLEVIEGNDVISLTLPNEETLIPGKFYYCVCYPGVLNNGYQLILTKNDGTQAVKLNTSQVEIKRSTFGVLRNVDANLEFHEYRDLQTDIEDEQKEMLALWRSLNGENWTTEYWDPYDTWKEDNPITNWTGLEFNERGTLKSINISTYHANGTLPDVFESFKDLEQLIIEGGTLSGVVPVSISKLKNLTILRLSGGLSGALPDLSSLVKLKTLVFSGADFSCPLPENLGLLQELEIFSLESCGLTGSIPEGIGSLPNLEYLNLSENRLSGNLPDAICNLTNLKELNLSANLLTGPIPENIGQMKALQNLQLRGHSTQEQYENDPERTNSFSGVIPVSIGNLSNLQYLDFSENQLSGVIPDCIWDLPDLFWLNLAFNSISGELSHQIGNALQLRVLNVSNNLLSGSLPDEIWTLSELRELNLGNSFERYGVLLENRNTFTGELSSSISHLSNLYSFSVNNCAFSGEIPYSITTLNNLNECKLSYNNFTGRIPDGIRMMNSLNTFWCQGNKLSGFVSADFLDAVQVHNPMAWIIMPQQEGYEFEYSLYESTDYSHDKEIRVLQQATSGNGINIVLMGDGFVDTDIRNGTYDRMLNLMYESLFEFEPFASHRDLFNIYGIVLVSKNQTSTYGETSLGIESDPAFIYYGLNNAVPIIDELIPGLNHDYLTVSIATRSPSTRPGCCSLGNGIVNAIGQGLGIAVSYFCEDEASFKGTVIHETCGHGFGKLGDEYSTWNQIADESTISLIDDYHQCGWFVNIDTTCAPEEVQWKAFLTIPYYIDEGIGIYEGGDEYMYGIWRPSINSVMRHHNSASSFNAPSREAIFRRIHKIAFDEDTTFEDFIDWDMQHRQAPLPIPYRLPERLPRPVSNVPLHGCIINVQ